MKFVAVSLAVIAVLGAGSGCTRIQKYVVKVPGASATLLPSSGSDVRGSVRFTQKDGLVEVTGRVTGLAPGPHGVHIHEKGNCSAPDGSSAGPHFNPAAGQHSGPHDTARHAGDLGNIIADAQGIAEFRLEVSGLSLGPNANGIVGRSVIVHADADDLVTQPAGNAGKRIGCGLISKDP